MLPRLSHAATSTESYSNATLAAPSIPSNVCFEHCPCGTGIGKIELGQLTKKIQEIARKQLHALVLDQLLQEPSCTHLVMSTPISLFHVLILTLSRITATQSLFLPSIYEFDHSWKPLVPLNVSGVSAVAVCPDDECAEVMYIALPLQAVQRSRILFLK